MTIPLHAERVTGEPQAVRWVVPAGRLPAGRISLAPGRLGEMFADGTLSAGLTEHTAVWLWLRDGLSWAARGTEVRAALQGAAQMNVLEFHPWNARNLHIDKPDRMVFDLDRGEGVPWRALQEGAVLVHALLDELGLQSWLKTSGGKGLHVVVPLAARWRFDVVKGFARAVVQHLASTAPERFVAKSGPANRRGRIFVDYLRNGEGATTVAAWSPRARPGLGVSMPLVWEELDQVKGAAQWTVSDAVSRLEGPHVDAWQAMAVTRQSLREPMKALGFRPDADGD